MSKQNNTAEQSDKIQQLYINENHSYQADFLIRENHHMMILVAKELKCLNKELLVA